MHLVQLLLPVVDGSGRAYGGPELSRVASELKERFGGVTAFLQNPATGLWKEPGGQTVRDDIVIFEVMVDELDTEWWSSYRTDLCGRFAQHELVVRAQAIRLL